MEGRTPSSVQSSEARRFVENSIVDGHNDNKHNWEESEFTRADKASHENAVSRRAMPMWGGHSCPPALAHGSHSRDVIPTRERSGARRNPLSRTPTASSRSAVLSPTARGISRGSQPFQGRFVSGHDFSRAAECCRNEPRLGCWNC
jgi:hypothetical protein